MTTSASSAFPLATEQPCTSDCGDGAGTANSAGTVNSEAGAGGSTNNTFEVSTGGMVAIIIVVALVVVMAIATATLFYIAKKREWKVRETIRKSARKVVTALTPRRSEFPTSLKDDPVRSRSGRARVDSVPPTPRLKPEDLEKGFAAKVKVKKYFNQK
ncbi:hypothetical protein N0V82_005824 [Gnomoniopsis sp. IMI 355080]|nr:hypothetical protein N0V82_005824 [Gnomoniopsis sp. IMI 355080]